MSATTSALIVAYGAIFLLGLAVAGLLRQVRHLQAHVTGQPDVRNGPSGHIGFEAPHSLGGEQRSGPYWALFASPSCSACELVVPGVLDALEASVEIPAYLVSDQPIDIAKHFDRDKPSVRTLVDSTASERFGVRALPWVIAVDAAGRVVVSEPLGSSQSMLKLIANYGNEVAHV